MPVYDDPIDARALDAAALQLWTAAIVERIGTPPDIAADVAEVLLSSDRRGIASHGTARLTQYAALVDAGVMDPVARPTIERDRPALVLMDANNGWGHHAGRVAMDLASGVCLCGIRRPVCRPRLLCAISHDQRIHACSGKSWRIQTPQ